MCGVLGIAIKEPEENDFELVRTLFIQSMIRGKHATGVSYVKNNKVHTIKEPVDANKFINNQNGFRPHLNLSGGSLRSLYLT